MDHLAEAKRRADRAECVDGVEWAQLSATLAIAHAAIAIAERLPPPAEAWSECMKRLGEEWRTQEKVLEETRDRVARGRDRVRGGTVQEEAQNEQL